MNEPDWDELRVEAHEELKGLLAEGRPYFVVQVTLLRDQPVFSDYRPQLWIGQMNQAGDRCYWDSVWLIHQGRMEPGVPGTVTIFPLALPLAVLFRGEHVEFYEGRRKTAEGEVIRIRCEGHADDDPGRSVGEQPIA